MSELSKQRILVTGVNGQVGRALKNQLSGKCELITATRTGEGADIALDLGDQIAIKRQILAVNPTIVINPAAYTQVDRAEDEPELAFAINADAPGVMAEVAKSIDATLVHYSTDYVFDGDGAVPYIETDTTNPVNAYGRSKLEGERAIQSVSCKHFIFRTCWVYDSIGANFPNAILARAKTMETLKVVSDQIGTPTSAQFIADITGRMLEESLSGTNVPRSNGGIFNLTSAGHCSWYDFAERVVAIASEKMDLAVKNIIPVGSSEFPTRAKRPRWSVLDTTKISTYLDGPLTSWEDALTQQWIPQ